MYSEGNGIGEIGRIAQLPPGIVSLILEEQGVKLKKRGRPRSTSFDENFFDEILGEARPYYLGLIFADGHVRANGYSCNIYLQEQDSIILERFREELNYTRPLQFKLRRIDHHSNTLGLALPSRHMCARLMELGRTNDKSATQLLEELPREEMRHFIRGYFDGDGTLYISQQRRTFNNWTWSISTKAPILEQMAQTLREEVGVTTHIHPDHGESSRRLMVRGNLQVKAILGWLYKDACFFMPRKFATYQRFLLDREHAAFQVEAQQANEQAEVLS